jgi:hypothetical protein
MTGYLVEVTEYSLERGNVRRSLHGAWRDGRRQPLDYATAAHRAWMLNAAQGLMLAKGPRTHTLTARVVVGDDLVVEAPTMSIAA